MTAPDDPHPITQLLRRAEAGDRGAFDEAYRVAYAELRRLAHAQRRRRPRADPALTTTALVHETYLRLVPASDRHFSNREHFMAVAAKAMRHVLVDAARARLRQKRGGGQEPASLTDEAPDPLALDAETLLAVDEALAALRASSERLHDIVEYRFFGGMTQAETASLLDCSERTIRRDWIKAQAWLRFHLGEPRGASAP